ncbi:mitochondrial carrier domain-containing protein [Jimgerdemannia flammicorona]|uniref:Mitochondrial carrier domain-containing protein n=1 Tax=Jimgerdemannia flammicorona TaxID=994334 RepID=A0A433DCT6_9FUNG|nr:mitochondrial carrier domain-containing protein [Jimgerdemannia flammicorona]
MAGHTQTYALGTPVVPVFAQDFVAGTVAGWAQVVVGHPFDTIKVRMQTQPNPPRYRNAVDCLRQTVQYEGARGLFKGVTSPLMGIGICNAVVFTANGNFRRMLQKGDESKVLSLAEITVAGSLSGFVMSFVNCPVELLKIKLQTQYGGVKATAIRAATGGTLHKPYTGVIDAGVRTFATDGTPGLYRGISITMLRDVPSFAAYFFTYEATKRALAAHRGEGVSLTNTDLLLAGGLAGFGAWLPCYPQDVIKSRMQSDMSYKTTFQAFRSLLSQRSARIFFRGFGPTMARAFPANAATFFAYEMAMKAMN